MVESHFCSHDRILPHLPEKTEPKQLRKNRSPWRMGSRALRAAIQGRDRTQQQPFRGMLWLQSCQEQPNHQNRPPMERSHPRANVIKTAYKCQSGEHGPRDGRRCRSRLCSGRSSRHHDRFDDWSEDWSLVESGRDRMNYSSLS